MLVSLEASGHVRREFMQWRSAMGAPTGWLPAANQPARTRLGINASDHPSHHVSGPDPDPDRVLDYVHDDVLYDAHFRR
jgi:hypothetical protein